MSDGYYTVRFGIPDTHRPLTYVASDEGDAYQYYDMLCERTGVEFATMFAPDGEILTNWRSKL